MPDETKKKHQKNQKHDPKEQRKSRQSRYAAAKDVELDTLKIGARPQLPPEKPVYQEPGPEFYKNLKRETDEILKITEDSSSKYKNKEIQSNWSKYEMPIPSYEEIEEQENIGADFEKLIQAPLTVGSYFQFKHEKSWDLNSGPSPYDKYFNIDMKNLAIAISTVPFYERNDLNKDLFSEEDMLSMINRSTRYKAKYYNDPKLYSTVEKEAEERIISNALSKETSETTLISQKSDVPVDCVIPQENDSVNKISIKNIEESKEIHNILNNESPSNIKTKDCLDLVINKKVDEDVDKIILRVEKKSEPHFKDVEQAIDINLEPTIQNTETKNSVLESPEDLEKWLDDFLDS